MDAEAAFDISSTLADHTRRHVATFQRLPVLQEAEVDAELDGGEVPFKVLLPGTEQRVTTLRVMAFTGKRIVNTFALQTDGAAVHTAAAAVGSKLPEEPPPLCRTVRTVRTVTVKKRKREAAFTAQGATPKRQPVQRGAAHFAAVLMSNAPTELSLADCRALLRACNYFMAPDALQCMYAYFVRAIQTAPIIQVCLI
jgi:hypothetical protein